MISSFSDRIFKICLLIFVLSGRGKEGSSQNPPADHFARGADISWLPQMEATGYKFYSNNAIEEDCFKILQDHGINSIRLRTFVNPSEDRASGHCSRDETVAMAVRARKWGMKVMIDFHYSDSWADPGKQRKPKAWEGHDFPTLLKDLYDYTFEVMTALKSAGVSPEWVQVGNEIPGGMIYPEGSTSNWPQLAQLINKGYDAIKAVSPQSKVILHLDQGNNNNRFRWWFDAARTNGARFDVIGLSYYPYWLEGKPDYKLSIEDLGANLNDMASRYGKEVMVVEVGGEDVNAQNTYNMLIAVQKKVQEVPGGKGTGVFYWEPQGARSWSRYALSAWGADGKPTEAMDAFALTNQSAGSNLLTNMIKKTKGLVALWTFDEKEGEQRKAFGLDKFPLTEINGTLPRINEGPLSGYSAEFKSKAYLQLPNAETGKLNISGETAEVTVVAWVKWSGEQIGFVSGMWNEYQDGGKRQYGLFVSLPYYNGRDQVCGHISRTGKPTPPFPYSIDYSASKQRIPANEWCCVAFSYNGKYIKSYFNGKFEPRDPEIIEHTKGFEGFPEGLKQAKNPYYFPDGMGDNGSDFTVGAVLLKSGMGNYFRGQIGGLAVFSRVLPEDELSGFYP